MKLLLPIVVLIAVIAGFFVFQHKNVPGESIKLATSLLPTAMPTPMPFEELTIPFLRKGTYTSSLGELSKLSETGTYTSFLTNYDSEGLKINGLLTQPKGEMPSGGWPAIVFIHGYIPPSQYKTTERYIAYVDTLARNGFVVFKIDLRGNGESEGTPSGAYYSSGYVIDALNAYAALQTSSFVNPKEIGLWGHSMAGNIVLRALATKPEIPAAVIWAGAGYTYVDLQQYGLHDNSYHTPTDVAQRNNSRQRLAQDYGAPDLTKPFWKEFAPVSYLSDLKGAIELHQAVNDDVVSIEYNRNLNKLLDATQVPHEFYEYPTGGHNIEDPSFTLAMSRTVAFYKKYLEGK